MDPYETLGITPAYEGDLKALRNLLVKRYFEAGETPDEERMKAINAAYELLRDQPRSRPAVPPLGIATSELPAARVGQAYRVQLHASGGAAPYTFEAALPPGLTLSTDGTLEGRVERPGTLPFTLTVTDRDGRRAERSLVVHVEPPPLRVVTRTLPHARVGVPYEAELHVNGGVAPLRWSGEPPAGLQFGDGLLYGTPHGPGGLDAVDVIVRDSARQSAFATLPLIVSPALDAPRRDRNAIAVAILLAAIVVILLSWLVA